MAKDDQRPPRAALRVVELSGEERSPVSARKCGQSTSGRTSLHLTAPSLSVSNAIASDSPNRLPLGGGLSLSDRTFRMYESDVPQRTAKDSCFSVEPRDLRYDLSASITPGLPAGNAKSIPAKHLPFGNDAYPCVPMEARLFEIRRQRLLALINEVGGQAELAARVSAVRKKAMDPSYISRLVASPGKKGRKAITGDMAADLETAGGKEAGWLSHDPQIPIKQPRFDPRWPFTIPRETIESMSDDVRGEIDREFTKLVVAALMHSKRA